MTENEDKKLIMELARDHVNNTGKFGDLMANYIAHQKTLTRGSIAPHLEHILVNGKRTMMRSLNELPAGVSDLFMQPIITNEPIQLRKQERMIYKELIREWQHPTIFEEHNLPIRRNILLYGPSGTGKTRFAHSLAQQTGFPFYEVKQSAVICSHLGESAKKVFTIFDHFKNTVIIFFDEIDSISMKRGTESEAVGGEMDRVVNTLLTCMNRNTNVIFFGATNRYEDMDPAVLRRFDVHIEMPMPDRDERRNYAQLFAQDHKMDYTPEEIEKFCEEEIAYGELQRRLMNASRSKIHLMIGKQIPQA